MPSATISGVTGGVLAIEVFSPSGAKPGRMTANVYSSTAIPETGVTVTLAARLATLTWTDCRVVKVARVSAAGARIVLEDSRWRMREIVMERSFNHVAMDGRVPDPVTLSDLWAKIAAATGLSIVTSGLPDLKPPAAWAGKTAEWCAEKLLTDTVCRMNYDPAAGVYRVMPAGTGALPDYSKRFQRQVAELRPASVNVISAPKVFEGAVTCEAVVPDGAGGLTTIDADATFDPIDLFTGFSAVASARRSLLQNTAFRLWRATTTAHPAATAADNLRLLGHRLQTLMPGADHPVMLGVQAEADGFATVPHFYEMTAGKKAKSPARIELAPGGKLFLADRTIVPVDSSGNIQTTVDMRCAYHVLDVSGRPTRTTETRAIAGGTAPALDVYVDWVRPVDAEDDSAGVDEAHAGTVLATIANALQTKYVANTEHLVLPALIGTEGSGQVGGVLYRACLRPRPLIETAMCLNFVPHPLTVQ